MFSLTILLSVASLTSVESTWRTSIATNLTGFISETRDKLHNLSRIEWSVTKYPNYELQRYNVTDTLIVPQRAIQLSNFCIKTRILGITYLLIVATEFGRLDGASFLVRIYYATKEIPYFTAYVCDIRATNATNQIHSGTDMMFIMHHLLIGIEVRECSLMNSAQIRYGCKSVPLIYLRCLKGRTTDWYSDFGYFNKNRAQIETEMRKIHDSSYRNTSFGPYLLALWNQENKEEFDTALKKNSWRFLRLKEFRDSEYWVADLSESRKTHRRGG